MKEKTSLAEAAGRVTEEAQKGVRIAETGAVLFFSQQHNPEGVRSQNTTANNRPRPTCYNRAADSIAYNSCKGGINYNSCKGIAFSNQESTSHNSCKGPSV